MKSRRLSLLLSLVLTAASAASGAVHPPDGSAARTDSTDIAGSDSLAAGRGRWDKRFRIVGGGAALFGFSTAEAIFPSLNINYRWSSSMRPESPEATLGMGMEVGTNYFVPYVKIGPEMRVRNFYVASHAGAAGIAWFDIRPQLIPFLGVASGYCFGYQWCAVELEAGANYGMYDNATGMIPYIAACLSFR